MRKNPIQLKLFSKAAGVVGLHSVAHGSTLGIGKRKTARPIAIKQPMHLILKSSKARGEWNLLRRPHAAKIESIIRVSAKKYGIKLYELRNVGNHIHLLVQTANRKYFQAFLRVITGQITMKVTGARKGNATGRFWDMLAFTRIVSWGRDFIDLRHYFTKNAFEGSGLILLTPHGCRNFKLHKGALIACGVSKIS